MKETPVGLAFPAIGIEHADGDHAGAEGFETPHGNKIRPVLEVNAVLAQEVVPGFLR